MTDPRREYALALVLVVCGGAVALAAAQAGWVVAAPVGERVATILGGAVGGTSYPGTALAPLIAPLGWVAIAGALAVVATRGLGRRIVGVFVGLIGLGLASAALAVLADPAGAAVDPVRAAAGGGFRAGAQVSSVAWWWPVLACAGGLLVVAGAALVVLHGARWPVMAASYERAGSPPSAGPAGADGAGARARSRGRKGRPPGRAAGASPAARTDAWSRLDRGEDPTIEGNDLSE
jgi:uncharacterized membrane protein (TIGR02234 family)